ncbi:NAD-glutamate dehydrogenase domain-containing protein [Novosphingobium sp. PS1R-30]|uniref:NAD-glutamate dehydrogenase domain-containing protein n=1 Tax=Novosphingobium anseongense TaxID=3133436 RepID=A0ABU8RVY7_9SPHN
MSSQKHLASAMAEQLSASLLAGEEGFSKPGLAEAARVVLEAAFDRKPGQSAIVVEAVTGAITERLTRIAVVNDDMPFLVDSIAATVDAEGLAIDRLVHPIITTRRGADGQLKELGPDEPDNDKVQRESIVYVETPRADARTRVRLRSALAATLDEVRLAVEDWPQMQAAMAADADRLAAQAGADAETEGVALLRWFREGRMTQLGHVLYARDGRKTKALGICRLDDRVMPSSTTFERAFAWFEAQTKAKRAQAPMILKSDEISHVHRRVPVDLVFVPVVEDGKITAISAHAGLWTSAALASPPDQVPGLRASLGDLMQRFGFDRRGHDGKALVHALTTLPHDLLIAFEADDLARVATAMMSLVDRPRPRILLVRSALDRHLYAFVWLPRDAMSTALRLQVQALLAEAAHSPVIDWNLEIAANLAIMRFVIDIDDDATTPDETELDRVFAAMVRGWPAAVEAELVEHDSPARAAALAARFAEAFPLAYRTDYGPAEAAADIMRLRGLAVEVIDAPHRDARFHCPEGCGGGQVQLKLYQRRGRLELSDAVPMLENFGFRVAGDVPTLLDAPETDGGELGAIHDFTLDLPRGVTAPDLLARAAEVEAAIAAVLNGLAEDDAFNRLITATGLAAHEANWLRAWYRYLRQATLSFGIVTVVDALANAPQVARGLIALFVARHDPAFAGDRAKAEAAAEEAIRDGLAQVSAINDDRLLRHYRALVAAMLRSNAFVVPQRNAPETALAFKIESAQVPGLPRPVPWREIFVYSRRVEGIHLRAGPVARGGLRWSDRRDDFRTEILGLMKAQRVKNAVIVPTGAKGGFYPKRLPDPTADREGWLAEGKASYQVFIRTLLSITDNIVGGKVVHPKSVVIRDGEDPYFVVAADKGTATFSDTANALAEEKDFWLDDAFASGGSKGYDHKAMGITARGAWLSVQRHFLERGVDVQSESIRVVGCGDMSGDVFGNGMLLSKALKVVAAFDHRHIFLDPDPDPAKSWDERNRMFALPRSSWDDYDKALISKGGGVFPRSLKSIPLSAEVREVLGIDAESTDPETLISAILKAPVDLLWFGGIGTYVKAAGENNVQVGDPANDGLRVDGREVRAHVIGEGANLGCTQAGRIEFSQAGGRINTDFIDNSAGVDCSDNEVNIKIALASAKREGRLTETARVKLLGDMTDNVAALVLEDNRLQALGLSIAEAPGPAATPSYIRVIEMLEERGQLDRKTEGLADNETLARRAAEGFGLSRPELAVLLSSVKLAVQGGLEESSLPDDPGLTEDLLAAFPPQMRRKFEGDILSHRLRREIIATKLANRMINRLGIVHPLELVEQEGATLAQVCAGFVAAERLFGMDKVWQAIETSEMPEAARIQLFDRAAAALRPQIADLLRAGGGQTHPSVLIEALQPGVDQLAKAAQKLLGSEGRASSTRLRSELGATGAPDAETGMVAHVFDMDGAVGLASLARDIGVTAAALTAGFIDLGARLGLDWAQAAAVRMNPSDSWERLLVAGLARDFQQMRLDFLHRTVTKKGDPVATVDRWAEAQAGAVRQFRAMIARAQTAVAVSPAILAQLASQARNLLAR